VAEGSDAGVEQSFVSVDVSYAVEEGLVEKRGFDGRFAVAEESDEVFERDGEGFFAGTGVGLGCDGESAEAASVDEAKFAATAEGEDGVSVGRDGGVGGGDEKPSGHTEMDEELGWLFLSGEIDDDGFAYAMNAVDAAAGEDFDDLVGWRLEGLGLVAGPDGTDGFAVDSLVDAIGYGFDFGEFRHGLLQYRP
jgi:hypothetical protein